MLRRGSNDSGHHKRVCSSYMYIPVDSCSVEVVFCLLSPSQHFLRGRVYLQVREGGREAVMAAAGIHKEGKRREREGGAEDSAGIKERERI